MATILIITLSVLFVVVANQRENYRAEAEEMKSLVSLCEKEFADKVKKLENIRDAQYKVICAREQEIEILQNQNADYIRTIKLFSTYRKQKK